MIKSTLYGLVLAGGKSTRMGRNKATLKYHSEEQWRWGFHLLSSFVGKCFISCAQTSSFGDFPTLNDVCKDVGPAGGLVTAHFAFPFVAWLCMAIDMPFITSEMIQLLISRRRETAMGTFFRLEGRKRVEPLMGIWEPEGLKALSYQVAKGNYRLMDLLEPGEVQEVSVNHAMSLTNLNTPNDVKKSFGERSRKILSPFA